MPPRRRKPASQRNRNLWLALALGGVLALGLVVGAVLLTGGGSSGAAPTVTTPLSDLDGIPQHGRMLGSPTAKVTLIEYADLSCPYCARYANEVLPSIVDRYVRPGRLKLEFRGLAFIRPVDNSARALSYAVAAGRQNKLWDYVERVYANQGQEGTEWFTDDFARAITEQVRGLDARKLASDRADPTVNEEIIQSAEQATAAHVSGTPTFFLKKGSEPPYPIVVSELSPPAFAEAIDDGLAG